MVSLDEIPSPAITEQGQTGGTVMCGKHASYKLIALESSLAIGKSFQVEK